MDWTPIESDAPSPLNEQLDGYTYSASIPLFLGWVMFLLVVAMIVLAIFRAAWNEARPRLIADVSTPSAEWTEIP